MPVWSVIGTAIIEKIKRLLNSICATIELGLDIVALRSIGY